MSLKKWLFLEIKFGYVGKVKWILAFCIFCITFYILFFLRPNEVNLTEQKHSYFFTCIIQSLNPTIAFIFVSGLVGASLRKHKAKWHILFEFVMVLSIIAIIGIMNFSTRGLVYNENSYRAELLLEELSNALAIGVVVGLIIVFIRLYLENLKNSKEGKLLDQSIHRERVERVSSDRQIEIVGNVKSEKFILNASEFIYAKSDKNYLDIFILKNSKVQKLTRRLSLANFLDLMNEVDHVFRVHQSYALNVNMISNIRGNTAGLLIKMENIEDNELPVSRSRLREFRSFVSRVHT